MLVKALSGAREILIEELQTLSKAVNQPIDIKEITSKELFSLSRKPEIADAEVSENNSSKQNSVLEVL